jgi:hypothetical protein
MSPIDPLTVFPGGHLQVSLSATDDDPGDTITFSVRSQDALPDYVLRDDQVLVFSPSPDQLGTYTFDVVASDGAAEAFQTVMLDVVADGVTTTRISGVVTGVDHLPVADVPIVVGPYQTTTDSEGSFTLAFPAGKVPTASLDIALPAGDPYFDPAGSGDQKIAFRRAISDPATGPSAESPLQHPNLISSFIDASVVYGSDGQRAESLRAGDGSGRLKTSQGDLLPQNDVQFFPDGLLENEHAGPIDPSILFVAGDVRASENPGLVALHTLLVREHNRKADELAVAHPGWTGDQLYQAARRWVGGLIQHITYNEFLPMLLGEGAIPAYSGYDATVDPGMSGLFSTAAFRLGHSIVAAEFLLLDENGDPLADSPLPLRDAFFNPEPILDNGIDPVLRGLVSKPAQELDTKVIDDLRNFLFGPPGAGGMDLVSMNLQRGRDLGLPSYNQARIDMGLPPAGEFADLTPDADVQNAMASVYSDVDDIDVWAGGLAEQHKPGAMLGELFWTVVRDQFLRLRDGDRFWYENEQFTDSELAEIRNTTLAQLIERNTSITALQTSVFTSGDAPAGPPAGGAAAETMAAEDRSFDGSGNNPNEDTWGRAGTHLLVNYTQQYGDGVSTPAGSERPPVRNISNAVFAQDHSIPSTEEATYLLVIWGQFLDHDIGLTPAGVTDVIEVRGETLGDEYANVQQTLPVLLGHPVFAGYNNVLAEPLVLPPSGNA